MTDAPLEAGAQVEGRIDWPRRFDHMQQHAGEHMLAGVIWRRLGGRTIGLHLGDSFSTIDVELPGGQMRVEPEVLAELAIKYLRGTGRLDARVLDLCSGTGCIGCAIAAELPRVRVVLADVSAAAMEISRRNVSRNGLDGRISFLPADVMKLPPLMTGSFDLVVSNPPYIPTVEIMTLDPSVRDYEPVWALDGGEDGLDFYRAILKNWALVIRQGGELMFEVGEDQAERVKDLMRMAGLREARSFPDTQNIQRVVAAKA